MRLREQISERLSAVFVIAVFILFLPFLLLILIGSVLYTPFGYVRYQRSRYQRDFPHKYTWLREPHADNEAYTAIKKNDLPIEYEEPSEDYDLIGRFVYKDTLLWFYPSVFFDKEKGQWLWWPGNKNAEEETAEREEDPDEEGTDDCLTAEELKEFLLAEWNESHVARKCSRVAFFYERRTMEREYGKEAIEAMKAMVGFTVYEKGRLAEELRNFIDANER